MVWRCAALAAAVALLAAGCAQDNGTAVFGYQASLPPQAAEVTPDMEAQLRRKTLATKVLAAIALERVTGRKPDPSRLIELN
ncbi:MAG: hypothetical protein DIU57_005080 [Pseudomonadota bacterium]|jgi:hypothetical protein|nr:MAG: hypothetical protein DIU57_08015 [Pseudomonadota bacterium]